MMRPQSHGGRRSSRDIIRLDCNEILLLVKLCALVGLFARANRTFIRQARRASARILSELKQRSLINERVRVADNDPNLFRAAREGLPQRQ